MKHWVRYYFPFSFSQHTATDSIREITNKISSLQLKKVANELSLPVSHTDKYADINSELGAWQPARYKTDPRFDDHLSKIFNGRPTELSTQAVPLCLKLTSDSITWLNGGKPGKQGIGLAMTLPGSSQSRLNAANIEAPIGDHEWPLQINDAWCLMFTTGIGMCVLEVCYQSPGKSPQYGIQSALEIQELNYHLARNQQNKQTPMLRFVDSANTPPIHGLATIVKTLVPTLQANAAELGCTPLHWESTYTYTVAEIASTIEEQSFKEMAFRLARKYTDAYMPSGEHFAANEYRFFDNIVHHFAIEGCCTLIKVAPDSPEAIRQFSETACKMAYEPIVTLVYSELVFLRAMTQGSNIDVDLHNPTEAELEQLRHYRTRLYNYRLNNRFAYVGSLTNHNDFFHRLRHVFNIDVLLKELSTDVQEIETFIALHLEEKSQRSLNKVKLVGSLVASLVLLTDLTGLNLYEIFYAEPAVPRIMQTLFWCSLSAIIIGFFVLFNPLKKK